MNKQEALFEYCLRIGDNSLILGHRLSEWCGHGPILEEDIALINIALDHVGRASAILKYAATIEGKGNSEDTLAYRRNEREFRNVLLVEQPNEDFAHTIMRQFLYDSYAVLFFEKLKNSADETLAGIAEKTLKETAYHLRHSTEWMYRLGDGTEESHNRLQKALNSLWRFTDEFFESDNLEEQLITDGLAVDSKNLKETWKNNVTKVIHQSTLLLPETTFMRSGGKQGKHSEHLGFLLAEMQHVNRSFPDATW